MYFWFKRQRCNLLCETRIDTYVAYYKF